LYCASIRSGSSAHAVRYLGGGDAGRGRLRWSMMDDGSGAGASSRDGGWIAAGGSRRVDRLSLGERRRRAKSEARAQSRLTHACSAPSMSLRR
jgi:hypothetical protein